MHKLIALWEGWAACILLPALALLVTADVTLRYVFNAPLAWGTDAKELLLLVVMTAGVAGTSWADEHETVSNLNSIIQLNDLINEWLSCLQVL